jgi:hypothetical protein
MGPFFYRTAVRRFLALVLPTTALALLFNAGPLAAAVCQTEREPILQLRVVPGELITADPALVISVHENDCVRIHLPAHFRRRGDYAIALTTAERVAIEDLSRAQQALPYTHADMLAEAQEQENRSARSAELFAVLDADYVELTRRDGGTATTTRALGLFQYAERYPDIENLKALEQIAAALIALSRRDDLVAVDTASTEAGGAR